MATSLEIRVGRLEAQARRNGEDLRVISDTLIEHGETLTKLKIDVAGLKADVVELKADVGELKTAVETIRVEHGAKLEAIAAMLTRLTGANRKDDA